MISKKKKKADPTSENVRREGRRTEGSLRIRRVKKKNLVQLLLRLRRKEDQFEGRREEGCPYIYCL